MRTWVLSLIVSLSLLQSAALVCAQAADSGQSENWAGSWAGAWTGESGGAGDMRLKLFQADGQWKGEAQFSLRGAVVPTVMKSLKIDGDKIEFEYSFDL